MVVASWRPPVGAVRRWILDQEELKHVCQLLNDVYGDVSTAAIVVAYVEKKVDFITEEAFVDHVEGCHPRRLEHRLKVLRRDGMDPIATLNREVADRGGTERPLRAVPMPRSAPALVLDADF